MLWLCLHFPLLPLEVLARAGQAGPAVVSAESGGRERVEVCNEAAARLGVCPGLRMSSVWALAPESTHYPRNSAREARALTRLAAWCGQFSDFVSLRAPDAVLLEVRGSLRLFGGLARLLALLDGAIAELGYTAQRGVAPTPLAASLLARAGGGIASGTGWEGQLAKIPLDRLEQPPAVLEALQEMGIGTVGACRRLPRSGLAQRFGPSLLQYLDRLCGLAAHPVARFEAPARYAERIALPAESTSVQALGFALRRLIFEFCGILTGHASGVQTFEVELVHERVAATLLGFALVSPSRDPAHLLMLVREKLERTTLDAPVVEVGLRAGRFESLLAASEDLFDARGAAHDGLFLDRLRVRLGGEAVGSVRCFAEHRPEYAWGKADPDASRTAQVPAYPVRLERPLWLLSQPLALATRDGLPCYEGELVLYDGPERIESGWWDGRDVTRDYFLAGNAQGASFWVFQELRRREWFLHGIFA